MGLFWILLLSRVYALAWGQGVYGKGIIFTYVFLLLHYYAD